MRVQSGQVQANEESEKYIDQGNQHKDSKDYKSALEYFVVALSLHILVVLHM